MYRSYLDGIKKYKLYILYSLFFCIISILILGSFFIANKAFVWMDDGISNNIVELSSSRKVLEYFFKNRLDYANYSIVENNRILRFFYWGIRNILGIPFAGDATIYAYGLLYFLQIYFSGIIFIKFCLYKKMSGNAILIGSIVYTFNGYSIYLIKQPVFGFTLMFMPLAFLEIERINDNYQNWHTKGTGLLFALVIMLTTLCNVTYIWPFTINLAVYIIALFIRNLNKRSLKFYICEKCKIAICIVFWWICGFLMSGFMVMPIVEQIKRSSRMETVISTESLLHYDINYILDFFAVDLFEPTGNAAIGIPVLALFFFGVLLKKKKSRDEKMIISLLVFSIICYLFPFWGLFAKGFSNISNRVWMYVMLFYIACMTVYGVESLLIKNKETIKVSIGTLVLYTLYLIFYIIFLNNFSEVRWTFLFIIISFFLIGAINKVDKKIKYYLIFFCTVFNNALFIVISTIQLLPQFLDKSMPLSEYYGKFVDSAAIDIENPGYYRIEKYNYSGEYNLNLPQWYGYNGTSVFHSILPSETCNFFIKTENNGLVENNKIYGFDSRSGANMMAIVRYQLVPANLIAYIPYNYTLYKENVGFNKDVNIYETKDLLPLGFTYCNDTYLSENSVDNMTGLEIEKHMLIQPVIDLYPQKGKVPYLKSDELKPLPFNVLSVNNVELSGQDIFVKENYGSITIFARSPSNTELYVRLKGLMPGKETCRYIVSCDSIEKKVWQYALTDYHKINRDAVSINMGYRKENQDCNIRIMFSKKGNYKLSNIELYAYDVKQLGEAFNELGKEALNITKIMTNEVMGNITVTCDKWMCISLPYDNGWDLYVDGIKTKPVKMNFMYMGTLLREGSHDIRLKYHIPGFRYGVIISCFGFLLGLIGYLVDKGYLYHMQMERGI